MQRDVAASAILDAPDGSSTGVAGDLHSEEGSAVRWERRRARLPAGVQKAASWIDRVLAWSWNTPLVFWGLVVLAVVSAIWGYDSFYGPQYPRLPWLLWIFVPDSPFSLTLWIAAVFVLRMRLDRSPGTKGAAAALFVTWAAAMNIKIGLWTPYVLLFYSDVFFAGTPARQMFQALLLVAHLGMVAYAALLVRKVRALPALGYVGVLAVLFVWDLMDYFFVDLFLRGSGLTVYPLGIPGDDRLVVTTVVTLVLSLLSAVGIWVAMRLRGPPSRR